ncbi:MAG: hypothetical protein WAS55_06240 [Saprospiraceae bacterium]
MKQFNVLVITAIIAFFTNSLSAQNTENSPLSRYGVGDLKAMSTGWMSGMANAGTAYISDQLYNPLNPAASSFLKQTDFELGIFAKYNSLKDNNNHKIQDWSGSLNNISMAIPLRNSINEILDRKKYNHSYAIQFGLTPYSSVGYRSELVDSSDKSNRLDRFLQGDGLINSFNLGGSYRYKNVAIGLQLNYLFGNLNYNQNVLFSSIPAVYDSYLNDKVHIRGWKPSVGFLYRKIINQKEVEKDNSVRKKMFSAGLVINLPSNYTGYYSGLHVTRFSENIAVVDTVLYVNERKEKGSLPFGFKAGVYYTHKEKYGLMGSFNFEDWQSAEFTEGILGSTKATSQFLVGGWYKPGQSDFDKFIKKSIYRFGAYLGNDYRSIGSNEAKSYGLTFGWGYPILFLRQDAMVHINFDVGNRTLENQITGLKPLSETYFMIHFGISINDNEWFLKRRYN